jgi:hypothetical protein
MKQREVTDDEQIRWSCVQAFGGISAEAAEEAASRIETSDGKVPVVCTPSGGAMSVRVQLASDWLEKVSDAELLDAISAARGAQDQAGNG